MKGCGDPKTLLREREGTQGPWRRGATGCCRLLRHLLVRYGWTTACVGTFVSLLALLDKTVENISTGSLPAQNVGQPHASEDKIVCRITCRWQHGRVGTTVSKTDIFDFSVAHQNPCPGSTSDKNRAENHIWLSKSCSGLDVCSELPDG